MKWWKLTAFWVNDTGTFYPPNGDVCPLVLVGWLPGKVWPLLSCAVLPGKRGKTFHRTLVISAVYLSFSRLAAINRLMDFALGLNAFTYNLQIIVYVCFMFFHRKFDAAMLNALGLVSITCCKLYDSV